MFTTGENVGLAEWIIDDTCLVTFYFMRQKRKRSTIVDLPDPVCIGFTYDVHTS